MFIRVDDKNNIIRYPYSTLDTQIDFPNVSFPSDFNDNCINDFFIFRVQQTQQPIYDNAISRLLDSVELVNGVWVQKWIEENLNEELAKYNVRIKRNQLLAQTDYMALSDTNLTTEWAEYRQALRDVTDQEGFPFGVVWPVKPS